jgi:hypothetical protein
MTGIEGELSAMISGSPAPPPPEAEPASPHPEEAPSEDDALEEVASFVVTMMFSRDQNLYQCLKTHNQLLVHHQ